MRRIFDWKYMQEKKEISGWLCDVQKQNAFSISLVIPGLLVLMMLLTSPSAKAQGLTSLRVFPDESPAFKPEYSLAASADSSGSTINRKRLRGVIAAEAALFAGTMYGLYQFWYRDYPQSAFHFYNDNNAWLQMDKIGHGITSYYVGMFGYEMLRWSGVPERQAVWYGGPLGFVYLLTVETLDGVSAGWGASPGDFFSNTAGAGLFIGQQLLWEEQRVTFKYSFHQTRYATYRPDLFGKRFLENMVKDYNGQTLWASVNLKSFFKCSQTLPEWLNVAVGYSGEGMTGAVTNETEYNGREIPEFTRHRQYLLSLDVDLTKIETESDFLRNLFNVVGFVKFPFPALEYNTRQQLKFHWLYF